MHGSKNDYQMYLFTERDWGYVRPVVVAINYRLNILGFPRHADLPRDTLNLGISDCVEALRWVKANIIRFGGDPDLVTIFGQGAGGSAVLTKGTNEQY